MKQEIIYRVDFLIHLGNFILLDIVLEESDKNTFC